MLDVEPAKLRAELASVRPASRLVVALLMVWIGLVVVGTVTGIGYLGTSETLAAQSAQAPVAASEGLRDGYEAIVRRPLFWRSRQPAAAPMEAAGLSAPPIVDLQISLRGVFINGDDARAFMIVPDNPRGVWRKRGEELSGWRVAEILGDRVVLESQAGRQVVPLSHTNGR